MPRARGRWRSDARRGPCRASPWPQRRRWRRAARLLLRPSEVRGVCWASAPAPAAPATGPCVGRARPGRLRLRLRPRPRAWATSRPRAAEAPLAEPPALAPNFALERGTRRALRGAQRGREAHAVNTAGCHVISAPAAPASAETRAAGAPAAPSNVRASPGSAAACDLLHAHCFV